MPGMVAQIYFLQDKKNLLSNAILDAFKIKEKIEKERRKREKHFENCVTVVLISFPGE